MINDYGDDGSISTLLLNVLQGAESLGVTLLDPPIAGASSTSGLDELLLPQGAKRKPRRAEEEEDEDEPKKGKDDDDEEEGADADSAEEEEGDEEEEEEEEFEDEE